MMASTRRKATVGVVGAGAVGQAVAMTVVASELCSQLLVVSRTSDQAAALVADLDDMRSALGSPTRPQAADVSELRGCDVIVVALRARFTNSRTTDVRMGGAQANAPAIAALASSLLGYTGTVLVVTNPVDLMTRLFAEVSGCDRVYGVGSGLDSTRYRLALAQRLGVEPSAVQGQVMGEHGDAAVVCASTTTVNELPVQVSLSEMRSELALRPGRISAGIGRTRAGPAGAVAAALRLVLGAIDGVVELSASYNGAWLGIPLRFTGGRPVTCLPVLSVTETHQFQAAQAKLRAAYDQLRDGLSTNPDHSEFARLL